MTKDNYLAFKEYETKLYSAVHSGYARFTAKEVEAFSKILERHRGTPLSRQERTCPRCFLSTLKKIAEEYNKYEQSPRGKAVLKGLENGEAESDTCDGEEK